MNQRPRKQARSLPPGALVRVVWIDADADTGWTTLADALSRPPSTVETVGWVVGHTDIYLVVAADRHGDHVNAVGRIPHWWVTDIEVLR
jgi:hypothetical protein